MSGIGDIIAVAQLGYKFAEALKGYIDEVGTAEESIKALVVEVEQASHRVKELSELIDGDTNTGFLTPVGLDGCHNLASEFKKTILSLKSVLVKTSDAPEDTGTAAFEFIDLSQWQKFRWPFIRKALAVPRARLGELKIELQLLMVTASAHKLSKMPPTREVEKQREDARAKLKRLSQNASCASSGGFAGRQFVNVSVY
ncbi:hypothetical protein UCRNP2_3057 [Neofusicoccum parvum UCRNP2]|uniref:Fungal N-terminal domain-containing protein n=1 Tax=Botryosphaeria parva (strain UCR-NP2) TaxID=1287680 RepID=R1EQS0_BOTPV|nr:hypothetical protein UCRNP2_3057 [Neofusicoccum parvum UCRNP2]